MTPPTCHPGMPLAWRHSELAGWCHCSQIGAFRSGAMMKVTSTQLCQQIHCHIDTSDMTRNKAFQYSVSSKYVSWIPGLKGSQSKQQLGWKQLMWVPHIYAELSWPSWPGIHAEYVLYDAGEKCASKDEQPKGQIHKNINDYPKSRDAMHEANFKQVHPILVNE